MASRADTSSTSFEPLGEHPGAELARERDVVDRIRRVSTKQVEAAADLAERLAQQAVEELEDGIREVVDEDGEADAAIRAATVRQNAAAAMHAYRRANELQRMGDARTFGSVTTDAGDRTYVGRVSVIDGDDVLMVDWRARAAEPFYRATPLRRMDVRHRRHLLYDDDADGETAALVDYSDEYFEVASLEAASSLRGEAAILRSVSAPTAEQMRSVVATIQAEQDIVVRASSRRPLVVQGGPGTGKTVVALHRAAYLLYNQRTALAETGVLIVGPSSEFLTYIAGVLPSLGESGVVSSTATDLYRGARVGLVEDPDIALLKGQLGMVDFLEQVVTDRQRTPKSDLVVIYGTERVRLRQSDLVALFDRSARSTHNAGAAAFRDAVIESLAALVYNPAFANLEEARSHFAASRTVRHFLLRQWPTLTPEQALNDVLGSPALLASACRRAAIPAVDRDRMKRERTPEAELISARWSVADIPLLDELHHMLGDLDAGEIDAGRIIERDDSTEFELADEFDQSSDIDWNVDDDHPTESDGDRAEDRTGFGDIETNAIIELEGWR